jgi:hypothetical protein
MTVVAKQKGTEGCESLRAKVVHFPYACFLTSSMYLRFGGERAIAASGADHFSLADATSQYSKDQSKCNYSKFFHDSLLGFKVKQRFSASLLPHKLPATAGPSWESAWRGILRLHFP